MKKVYLILLPLALLMSCISFKSEYPVINYYNLNQENSKIDTKLGIDHTILQIRDVSAADNFDTDQLSAVWNNQVTQKYFYHRWTSDVPVLVTDFLFKRVTDLKIFKGGVIKSSSMINPDLILETKITDMTAYSFEHKKENYVSVSLQVNLIKRSDSSPGKILMSDVFSVKKTRKDNTAESIAPAFSAAVSEVCDKMLEAIELTINKENTADK